jgi:hypothetical protein
MTTQVERDSTIGRHLGSPEWIAMLERRLGALWHSASPAQSRVWSETSRGKRSCCET